VNADRIRPRNSEATEIREGAYVVGSLAHFLAKWQDRIEHEVAEGVKARDAEGEANPELPPITEGENSQLWDKYRLFPISERSKHPSGSLGRAWIPSARGSAVGQLSREITDSNSRIFRRRTSGRGGVVVIDCSGSMSLRDKDIERILSTAGGAVIIAYHERNSVGEIYYLADGKRRVRELPDPLRNGCGNGVDGEALRIGAKHHRKGEPFIWVSDGGVCVSTTNASTEALVNDCRKIMRRERGLYAHDPDQAIRYLRALARGASPRSFEPDYWRNIP
jgi:hypothetical protein